MICTRIMQKDEEGRAKYLVSILLEVNTLAKYLSQNISRSVISRGGYDLESLTLVANSFSKIVNVIKGETNQQSSQEADDINSFQIFDELSIGCIVCKKQSNDLVIIFANKKVQEFGTTPNALNGALFRNVVQIEQKSGNEWSLMDQFIAQKIPSVEYLGQFNYKAKFKAMGHYSGNYIVFNLYPVS